jgi:bifunctional UDP-N-acetylglucosamine pyrophosphorylase / glucosamine-1-phosphate N-acetyltransferase
LPLMRAAGGKVVAHLVEDASAGLGVNTRADLAEAQAVCQRRIRQRHMLAGVTITDPASTVIEADVRIGEDSVIEPYTFLRGRVEIGSGCRVGPLTTLSDCILGNEVSVLHSHLEGCEVLDGCTVGPFAYLRPGTKLRERAKAGTFVEVKNSDIGAGTKIPHLSYVGDADLGPETNIGAGNITANYDGRRKHRTVIGKNVHTGVDTVFIAPVTVGDNAYTAAGSVITDDVPEGALGIARARQQNMEGYAEEVRRDSGPAQDNATAGQQTEPETAGNKGESSGE